MNTAPDDTPPPARRRAARPEADEVWVQLATRIPQTVHRQVKLACVHRDESLMSFVVDALVEKLGRDAGLKLGPYGRPSRVGRP